MIDGAHCGTNPHDEKAQVITYYGDRKATVLFIGRGAKLWAAVARRQGPARAPALIIRPLMMPRQRHEPNSNRSFFKTLL